MDKTGSKQEKIWRLENELEKLDYCSHEKVEIRYKIASNSAVMYTKQCMNCGELLKTEGGLWIKKEKVCNKDQILPVNDEIRKNFEAKRSGLRQALTARIRAAKNAPAMFVKDVY